MQAKKLTHDGITQTVAKWAKQLGYKTSGTLRYRLKHWPVDKALSRPKPIHTSLTFGGVTMTLTQWAKHLRYVNASGLQYRIEKWGVEKALTTPAISTRQIVTPVRKMHYRLWTAMKQRCSNPNHKQWKDYGGRGISVCTTWSDSFNDFIADVGFRPDKTFTLDRIDNNGDYEPGNVKWSTRIQNQSNMRSNRFVTYKGETQTISEWARRYNITPSALCSRINEGWDLEDAMTRPIRQKNSAK